MKKIKISFFGSVKIIVNNQEIQFPYEKVYLLLLYLLVHKRVSRDTIASILWSDIDISDQRKNLRNALYVLRKNTVSDFILTPNREYLEINEKIPISFDYHDFMNSSFEDIDLKVFDVIYKEVELKKIGSAANFVVDLREKSLSHFVKMSFKYANVAEKNKDNHTYIEHLNSIIKHDPYNEQAYRALIKFYYKNKQYEEALDTFYTLEKSLETLNKNCERETIELFEKVVARNKRNPRHISNLFFTSRQAKLGELIEEYNRFDKYDLGSLVNIVGKKGIGKSNFIRYFIDYNVNPDTYVLQYRCFENNLEYAFMFIDYLITECSRKYNVLSFSELYDTLKIEYEYSKKNNIKLYNKILDLSEELLVKLLYKNKILIVIEDVHYLDKYSLAFINRLIKSRNNNLMLLISSNNYPISPTDEENNSSYEISLMKKIQLDNLTKDDYSSYYKNNNIHISSSLITSLMRISNSDFFTLQQSARVQEYKFNHNFELYEKINSQLNEKELKIIKLLASYGREMSIILIHRITRLSKLEIQDILKVLKNMKLIEYYNSSFGNLYYICSSRYMDYVYDSTSAQEKAEIHEMIASKIENETNFNVFFSRYYRYQFLIMHYRLAKNELKTFEYTVKYYTVKDFFICELFPLSDYSLKDCIFNYDNSSLNINWSTLENEMNLLIDRYSYDKRLTPSLIQYYIMKTRFYLTYNELDQAYDTLSELENLDRTSIESRELLNINYLTFYYAVNTNNTELMLDTLIELRNNVKYINSMDEHIKSSVNFYRLSGYYFIIINNPENARKNLNYALKLYYNNIDSFNEMYLASILHYQGQLALLEENYDIALENLKECYRILLVDNVLHDAIFLTKCLISIAHFLNKEFKIAWTSCVEIEKMKKHQNFMLKDELINAYIDIVLYNNKTEDNSYSKYDKEIYSRIKKIATGKYTY